MLGAIAVASNRVGRFFQPTARSTRLSGPDQSPIQGPIQGPANGSGRRISAVSPSRAERSTSS